MNNKTNDIERWLIAALDEHDDEHLTESDGSVTAYAYPEASHGGPAKDCPYSIMAERDPDGGLFVSVATPGMRGYHEPKESTTKRDRDDAAAWLLETIEEVQG